MIVWLPRALLAGGAGITLFGLSQMEFSLRSSQLLTLGAVLALALITVLVFRRHPRVACVLSIGIAAAIAVPAAVAWALVLAACWSLGVRVLPLQPVSQPIAAIVLRLTVGLAILAALFSMLLPWPINSPALYGCILLAIAWGLSPRPFFAAAWVRRSLSDNSPLHAVFQTILLAVVILLFLPGFFSLVEFDALALHERMANELWFDGRYAFDVASHNWAAAPFATDLFYAVGYVASGGDERVRAYQFLTWVLMLSGLYFGMLPRRMSGSVRVLLLAVLLSTPLFFYLAHTLHAEMLLLVYLLSGIYLLFAGGISPGRRLLAMAILCGALAATKVPGLIFAAVLASFALVQMWREKTSLKQKAFASIGSLLAGALIGGQSYFWAWYTSGNPVLPLYNAFFSSRYFSHENFSDARWVNKLDWTYPYDLLFDTGRFVEWATPGWAGFQYIFLLAAALVSLRGRTILPRLVLAILLIYVLIVLPSTQYLRYQLPTMALLSLMAGYGLRDMLAIGAAGRRLWLMFLGLCLLANIAKFAVVPYPPGLDWPRHVTEPQHLQQLVETLAPERDLAKVYNALYQPDDHLLVNSASRLYWAPFRGKVTVTQWYNHLQGLQFHAVRSVDDARRYLRRNRFTYAIIYQHADDAAEQKIAEVVRASGTLLASLGNVALYRLPKQTSSADEEPVAGQIEFSRLSSSWIADQPEPLLPSGGVLTIQAGQSAHWPFALLPAHHYRYLLEFRCAVGGAAAAQVNWEDHIRMLASQYESFPCTGELQRVEIPLRPVEKSVQGRLYLRTHENHPVSVVRAAVFAEAIEEEAPNSFMPLRYRAQ